MEEQPKHPVRLFFIELMLYSGLVLVYVFLVIGLLSYWLKGLYDNNKASYAIAALALIIGQGVLLEIVTSALLRLVKSTNE